MQNSRSTLRALMLGSAMGLSNALGGALGGMRSIVVQPQVQTATAGGKGKGKSASSRPRSFWYRPTCTSSQKTRNPADPAQAYLIDRAEHKREMRQSKAYRGAKRMMRNNQAHKNGVVQLLGNILSDTPARLNPLYVSRSN